MSNRKRTLWVWIVCTVFVLPVHYVMWFGPACWWFSAYRGGDSYAVADRMYFPMAQAAEWSQGGWICKSIAWYALAGTSVDFIVVADGDLQGKHRHILLWRKPLHVTTGGR